MEDLASRLFERIAELQEAWYQVHVGTPAASLPAAPTFEVHATAFELVEERITDLLTPPGWGMGPHGRTSQVRDW